MTTTATITFAIMLMDTYGACHLLLVNALATGYIYYGHRRWV